MDNCHHENRELTERSGALCCVVGRTAKEWGEEKVKRRTECLRSLLRQQERMDGQRTSATKTGWRTLARHSGRGRGSSWIIF